MNFDGFWGQLKSYKNLLFHRLKLSSFYDLIWYSGTKVFDNLNRIRPIAENEDVILSILVYTLQETCMGELNRLFNYKNKIFILKYREFYLNNY